MESCERTRELLIKHYQTYPLLHIQDILKFLHQSAFGCEHMVSSVQTAIDKIAEESVRAEQGEKRLAEPLDGAYSRLHLSHLASGLSVKTFGKLFYSSAKTEQNGKAELECKLAVADALVQEGILPFDVSEFQQETKSWCEKGYPPLHHSEAFHNAYCPSYRVIANRYVPFLPLLARLDTMLALGPVVLAIDGGSASGKTTLSEMLRELYDAAVFHMDDFFLREEQRTPERYAQVGGNIDHERFLEEVLIPLSKREPVRYRRFDCSTLRLQSAVEIVPVRLTVVEGAYSMHPSLAEYYDFSVFLDIDDELQKIRIQKRNTPQLAQRFFDEWIPLERVYFSQMQVKQRCDMAVVISE